MYSKVEYWNMRYEKTVSSEYEWYQNYEDLKSLFDRTKLTSSCTTDNAKDDVNGSFCPTDAFPSRKNCRILILGCGSSQLGEEMQQDGWSGKIVNIDYSSVLINQMKSKYTKEYYERIDEGFSSRTEPMEFICADITKRLPFEEESFDLIICKGSFDAIVSGVGATLNIKRLVLECVRLLKDGNGVLFLVTNGNPDSRIMFLEHNNDLNYYWKRISVHTLPGKKNSNTRSYVYICGKRAFKSMDHLDENTENILSMGNLKKK